MALHINLFHEEQSKIVERKRDPLKLGILGLLVVAMCFYAYYLVKVVQSNKIAGERARLDSEWARLSPLANQAKADEEKAKVSVTATTNIERLINGRFYWGPLLSEIVAGTGPEIQITSFDGMVRSPESVTLTVSGVSAGKEPRAVAERFRQSLEDRLKKIYGNATSQFNTLENSDAPLVLSGKSFSTANFSIGFQLTLPSK